MTKIRVAVERREEVVVEFETEEEISRSDLYDKVHDNAGAFIEQHPDCASVSEPLYYMTSLDVKVDK